MTAGNDDYGRHSPDVLLQVFSRSRLVLWCVVAVGIHVLVTVATSTSYIRDRWIDPEGAAARKAAVEAKKQAGADVPDAGATNAPAAAASNATVTVSAPAEAKDGSGKAAPAEVEIDGVAVPADRTNSAVFKAITSTAKPEELPADSDLGISLDDTRL